MTMQDQGQQQHAAGWYPDPQARFDQRWYDGTAWTPQVMRAGVASIDAAMAAVASWPPAGGSYGQAAAFTRPGGYDQYRFKERNSVGAGFPIAVLGAVTVIISFCFSWFGDQRLLDLQERSSTTIVQGAQTGALWVAGWSILAVISTTLPYQPGKLVGFILGSLIGLGVCWQKLDRHSPSTRANVLVAIFGLVQLAFVWVRVAALHSSTLGGYDDVDIGLGPWVMSVGLGLLVLGALVGRSHERVRMTS